MAERMNDAQQGVTDDVSKELAVWLVQAFAQRWVGDEDITPSASSRMMALARSRYAIPVGMGAMTALARFSWDTAPPGSSPNQLAAHMAKTAYEAVQAILHEGTPAGSFWTHVANSEGAVP